MIELTMYNARKHYGDISVLNDASFTIYEGDKVGVVGVNGSGKTTILKLLAGIETMDIDYRKICEGKSRISIPKGTTIGYLEQFSNYNENYCVKDILYLAFKEIYCIEEQLEALEAEMEYLQGPALDTVLKKYSNLQQDFEVKGGYERDEIFSRVCTGLKFDDTFLQKEFNILSGGEKTTVNLGRILLESSDVLLLDEPTNHLDMQSVEWLEKYLKSYKGIVIIVSHDRYFLDNVVTKIVEVEDRKCVTYTGNYTDYCRQKEESMLLQFENYKEQQKKINSMENTIKDLRDWAQRADNNKFFRRAASIQRKLDKIEIIDRPSFEKKNMKINFKSTDHYGYEMVSIKNLSKSFGNKVILNNAELFITLGERIALVGPNGCGKTTIIKILLSEMNADSGQAKLGANVKVAYLPQNITFKNEEDRIIDCFREDKYILEGKAREYLARFMFYGKEPFKKVKDLSGGEKVRLKLCMLLFEETNLLILDEPTNHLDIDSIETLEEALEDFKGSILFISHDRYFINKICSRVVAIEECKFVSYPGDYDNYKKIKNDKLIREVVREEQYQASKKINRNIEKNIDKVIAKESKSEIDIARLESEIKLIEAEIKEIDNRLYMPNLSHGELNKLYCEKENLDRKLEKMIGMWLSE